MSDERGVKGSTGPDLALPAYNELRLQAKHLVTCYGLDVVMRMLAIHAGETASTYQDQTAIEAFRRIHRCVKELEALYHRR
ncbi:hypothetical protein LCGC14_0298280 [marine sediment metagenome]|uniref:Uncharacterized protein n=1 Tax=marine sediment metagenome TaxID=412755 RepID=A0A0F9WX48_9ZZZZ